MTLDIIVPHYKEPWDICKYLFDSIAMQRGVDFKDISVIVVNDGDCLLSEDCFKEYPYKVNYVSIPHSGVSAARNHGLDISVADYVMFCDIDDGFLNNLALYTVYASMNEGVDFLYSNFIEEVRGKDGGFVITPHEDDLTFVHGKAYKRKFLIGKNIRFAPELTLHEDGYFNMVAYLVAKNEGKVGRVKTPIYLWRWNGNSVVRSSQSDFVLKTYEHVMKGRTLICDELKRRGYEDDYKAAVIMTVMNSFYDFQKPSYRLAENKEYCKKAEAAFREYYRKFANVFRDCTNLQIAEIALVARANACKNGMLLEYEDLRSFLKRVG